MKKILMGLAGLGLLAMGAGANASPLSTGTNLATPDSGVSEMVDQVRHRYGHRGRHLGWYKGNRGRHLGWYGNPGRHRGWGGGGGGGWGHGRGHGGWR
jgi:hypothetical protein